MNKINSAVEKNRELILNTQNYIWNHPETGYKEVLTSKYLEDAFENLGYKLVKAGDIPGFYTVFDTGRPGPEVMVLGELDALICESHPDADPDTGAVHACGHSAQCAALVGVAAALREKGVTDELSGKIRLCAVPAEELIEIEYRSSLIKEGRIHYMGGKTEFLYRGLFDGVDLAFLVHTTSVRNILIRKGSVGMIAKQVLYEGVAAHAGGSPWDGRNALYAATLGLSAINSIRETFKEQDITRVHPIITKGGDVVNAIPDDVRVESYIRGRTFEAMVDANKKVNRALCGSALSLGVNIKIHDMVGYAPLVNSNDMMELARDAASALPEIPVEFNDNISSGSTDMGDLSCVMPVVHPYMPGSEGRGHGSDARIANPEWACVGSAKWQMNMLYLLLKDGAQRAKAIIKNYDAPFKSYEEYFNYVNNLKKEGNRINYNSDGTASVDMF